MSEEAALELEKQLKQLLEQDKNITKESDNVYSKGKYILGLTPKYFVLYRRLTKASLNEYSLNDLAIGQVNRDIEPIYINYIYEHTVIEIKHKLNKFLNHNSYEEN
jgi:uncharacterized membrane protein